MFDYQPYIPQPASAFVNLTFKNKFKKVKFHVSNKANRRIIEMQYTRNYINKANILHLKLFDETWGKLEDEIIDIYKSKDVTLEFNYGWIGNTGDPFESPNYNLKLLHIVPEFRIDGIIMDIEGISNAPEFFQNNQQDNVYNLKKMTCKYLDEFNKYLSHNLNPNEDELHNIELAPITPSDVIKMFAKKYKLNTMVNGNCTIDETHLVYKHWSSTETIRKPYIPPLNNITIGQYIRDELIPISCSKLNNKPGFAFWIVDEGDRPTLYFKQIMNKRDIPKPRLKYIYLREQNSEVKSFKPQLLGTYFGMKGDAGGALEYHDAQSDMKKLLFNKATKVNCSDIKNDIPMEQIGGNEYVLLKTTNDYSKNTKIHSKQKSTVEQSKTAVADSFIQKMNTVFKAELTIVCNPTLNPQNIISIEVPKPDGQLHYSSGDYKIMEISDRFSNGDLQSTIKLIRNSLMTTEQQTKVD